MKLKKLILENFRQFYDTQEILLDVTNEKNVVVIHGENGSGKTTILQAFLWCLYEEFNLEFPDKLLNEHIFSTLNEGEKQSVKVTLLLDDRHKEYCITREVVILKQGDRQVQIDKQLNVKVDGKKSDKPQDTINRILHKKLKDYFFFDGERIDKLAQPEYANEIREGIKSIMGIEILEQSINHLKEVKRELTREFQNLNNNNIESPQEKKIKAEIKLEEIINKLESKRIYLNSKEDEKAEIEKRLEEVREIEHLVKQRQELEKTLNKYKKERDEIIGKEKELTTNRAYLAISNKLIQDVSSFLEDKRMKGELPAGIREQFIKDLINKGKCICGRDIFQGDQSYENLLNILNKTINENIENKFIELGGFLTSKINYANKFREILCEILKKKKDNENEIADVLNQIKEIEAKIKEEAPPSSSDLIRKKEEIEEDIKKLNQEIGKLTNEKENIKYDLEKINKEIEQFVAKSREQQVALNRLKLCEKALEYMNSKITALTIDVKNKLSEKVREIFEKIIRKDYYAYINDDFALRIEKNINGKPMPVAKSTGENQVSSLAFISSLIYIARQWEEDNKKDILTGAGVYPLVMDSPFGTLDTEYRDLVSKNIQNLAPQIILFLSKSQWSEEIEKNLKNYINHQFILQYYNPKKEQITKENKFIKIDEQLYELEKESDFEYTEIIRVK